MTSLLAPKHPLTAALVAALVVFRPWLGLVGLTAIGWRRRPRRPEVDEAAQQALAARIVLVGLTAGIPLLGALELAVGRTRGKVAEELSLVTRRSRREGVSQALTHWTGPTTNPLLARLAMSAASGAPMAEAVTAYLAELRLARRTVSLERARRLPVTLMIPLGLLILPGFVLLFVGPILLGSLTELAGALPS